MLSSSPRSWIPVRPVTVCIRNPLIYEHQFEKPWSNVMFNALHVGNCNERNMYFYIIMVQDKAVQLIKFD